jgi:hypothetical protein
MISELVNFPSELFSSGFCSTVSATATEGPVEPLTLSVTFLEISSVGAAG